MMERFDNGVIHTVVPAGWKVFEATDSDGRLTDKKLYIYKNAEQPLDIFQKVGITVCYFGKDTIYLSPKWFYDDVVDLEPFPLGRFQWEGFRCKSLGYPYVMLEGRLEGAVWQVMILLENQEERICPGDEDVRRILESL